MTRTPMNIDQCSYRHGNVSWRKNRCLPYRDTKDPCPVFDGKRWHIYGSGGTVVTEEWSILHATSSNPAGPWDIHDSSVLHGVPPSRYCAPGVVYEEEAGLFHMFVHTDCFSPMSEVFHLTSRDGSDFFYRDTVVSAIPNSYEAGIYDPHPVEVTRKDGSREYYLVYTGYPDPAIVRHRTDYYLARSVSGSWNGPWERMGIILHQKDVPHHNQQDQPDFEWGIEGPQIVQLDSDLFLLIGVCFLPEGARGTRQRVFMATAPAITGPYTSIGPILDPAMDQWGKSENGHAAGVVSGNVLHLFYQARTMNNSWKYGVVDIDWKRMLGIVEPQFIPQPAHLPAPAYAQAG